MPRTLPGHHHYPLYISRKSILISTGYSELDYKILIQQIDRFEHYALYCRSYHTGVDLVDRCLLHYHSRAFLAVIAYQRLLSLIRLVHLLH